jgi:hypothetical protein
MTPQEQELINGLFDRLSNALFGHPEQRRASSLPPTAAPQRPNYAPPPSYAPGGPSFLGTAAAAAAGTIGGSLLLGSIRDILGGAGQGAFGYVRSAVECEAGRSDE